MRIRTVSIISILLFIYASISYGGGTGTTGGQFLKITPGVRPAGMGNAFAGLADDINSINFNPAGLGFIKGTEILLMHNQWIEEIKMEHLACGMHLGNTGTLGLTATTLSMGDINKYDNTGAPLNASYTASDMSVGLAYARKFGKYSSAGLALKLIQQKIEAESASAFGADIGFLYRGINVKGKTMPLGLAVQNIGSSLKFRTEADPLPMIIRLGASYEAVKSVNTAFDIRSLNDGAANIGVGFEYKIPVSQFNIRVRAGYDTAASGASLGGLYGMSAGFGFETQTAGLDFSWSPYGDIFGNTYRAGLTYRFGKT